MYYAPIDQGVSIFDFEQWLQDEGEKDFNRVKDGRALTPVSEFV